MAGRINARQRGKASGLQPIFLCFSFFRFFFGFLLVFWSVFVFPFFRFFRFSFFSF
jgi:hypothetical protein